MLSSSLELPWDRGQPREPFCHTTVVGETRLICATSLAGPVDGTGLADCRRRSSGCPTVAGQGHRRRHPRRRGASGERDVAYRSSGRPVAGGPRQRHHAILAGGPDHLRFPDDPGNQRAALPDRDRGGTKDGAKPAHSGVRPPPASFLPIPRKTTGRRPDPTRDEGHGLREEPGGERGALTARHADPAGDDERDRLARRSKHCHCDPGCRVTAWTRQPVSQP